jgi:hypothetical protein
VRALLAAQAPDEAAASRIMQVPITMPNLDVAGVLNQGSPRDGA